MDSAQEQEILIQPGIHTETHDRENLHDPIAKALEISPSQVAPDASQISLAEAGQGGLVEHLTNRVIGQNEGTMPNQGKEGTLSLLIGRLRKIKPGGTLTERKAA